MRGVPTSRHSEQMAREGGIEIVGLDAVDRIDVTIDGADEVDPRLNLIKGLGGALVREKIVAVSLTQGDYRGRLRKTGTPPGRTRHPAGRGGALRRTVVSAPA